MSESTDKLRPCSLRSSLSALRSGGRRFEEGSNLCFTYLKKYSVWYEGNRVISVRACGCGCFVGRQQWWLVEEWLSARPRCQRVQSLNLKGECPENYSERYPSDVTAV